MRILLDTNVVLSALLWRGSPYELYSFIRDSPEISLFTSTALSDELADVMLRPSAVERLRMIGQTAAGMLAAYAASVNVGYPRLVHSIVATTRTTTM